MAARNAQEHRRDELLRVLAPVVAELGFDLEDATVTAAGRRSVIRIVIDSDAGVDLDEVAEVARAISDSLDSDLAGVAAFSGPYVLEVSSPGTDRLLTEPRHWRRAVGRLVSTSAKGSSLRGRITSVTADEVSFDVAGTTVQASIVDLAPGRVELDFTRSLAEPAAADGDEDLAADQPIEGELGDDRFRQDPSDDTEPAVPGGAADDNAVQERD